MRTFAAILLLILTLAAHPWEDTSHAPTHRPLPACANEDGPGPCRWDAPSRGNGCGRSYTLDADNNPTFDDGFGVPTVPTTCGPWHGAERARTWVYPAGTPGHR